MDEQSTISDSVRERQQAASVSRFLGWQCLEKAGGHMLYKTRSTM